MNLDESSISTTNNSINETYDNNNNRIGIYWGTLYSKCSVNSVLALHYLT